MATFESLFGNLPIEHRPVTKAVLSPKQKVLNKLDVDMKELDNASDEDDLGYGTALFPHTNKKEEVVVGRMKSWSGSVGGDGKREVRMVLGTSIVFFDNKRVEIRVENTVEAVKKGMNTLRKAAEGISESEWETVALEMAKSNQKKREKKEANKRK
jgi:hypothetical protein